MKMSKKNKKGVSLVYVIMASAVLMILSGALTASASHNIDLTARSTEGRQAYITAKSAMEYAKGVVNKQADGAKTSLNNDFTLSPEKLCNNSDPSAPAGFKDFSVAPDDAAPSQFKQIFPSAAPNGTTVYGQCKITLPDNTKFVYHIVITVKVVYNNGFSKNLIFQADKDLTKGSAGPTGAPFLSFGGRYGYKSVVVKNDGTFNPVFETGNQEGILSGTGDLSSYDGSSAYPVILIDPVRAESTQPSRLKAPSVFFMATRYNGGSGNWLKNSSFYMDPGTGSATSCVTLSCDFIYIAGEHVRGYRATGSSYTDEQANQVILNTFSGAARGVICFAQDFTVEIADDCDGTNCRTVGSISAGYYYFDNSANMNLFSAGTLSRLSANRITSPDAVKNLYNVDYIVSKWPNLYSTNNTNDARNTTLWAVDGKVSNAPDPSTVDQSGKDVYFYIERNDSVNLTDPSQWNGWVSNGTVYSADYISLMYATDGTDPKTTDCPMICNNISFKVKRGITLNSQKEDGPGDSSDVLIIKQKSSASKFNVSSEDGSPVKVYLPHNLIVEKSDGSAIYETKSAGNYTIPSGTDIFSGDHFTPASGGSGWDGGDMG